MTIIQKLKIFCITFILLSLNIYSCEIHLNSVGDKKPKYSNGDEIILKVEIVLTHKNCPESLEKTKFILNGLKVLGQTKWIEKGTGTWERKLKLQVSNPSDGKASVKVERKCEKEGVKGTFNIITD